MKKPVYNFFRLATTCIIVFTFAVCCQRSAQEMTWWRGNLHTHTFWSDGDDFPESVAKWYKDNGYDFLVFTDHNILLETPESRPAHGNHRLIGGELWQRIRLDHPAVKKYLDNFGSHCAEMKYFSISSTMSQGSGFLN